MVATFDLKFDEGEIKTTRQGDPNDMERELPFNPYEVCRNIAMERTTFKVGDTQIIFEPQFTPLHAFKGTALYFRQIVKGKLHARSEFVTREDLGDSGLQRKV